MTAASDDALTTVLSWGQLSPEKDVTWRGETYTCRKDLAFAPYVEIPQSGALPEVDLPPVKVELPPVKVPSVDDVTGDLQNALP